MALERFTAEQIFINLREGQAGSDGVADRIVVPQSRELPYSLKIVRPGCNQIIPLKLLHWRVAKNRGA